MEGGMIWLAIIGVLVVLAVLVVDVAVVLRRRQHSIKP